MVGRKGTALLLTALLLLCVPSLAAEPAAVYLAKGFDATVTNALPEGVELSGAVDARVVEWKQGTDKALYFQSDGAEAKAAFSLSGSGPLLVLKADIRMSGSRPEGKIIVKAASGAAFTALTLRYDGEAVMSDGRWAGTAAMDKMTTVALAFRLKDKRYSVYIDGQCTVRDQLITGSFPSDIGSVAYSFKAPADGKTELLLDNVYAHQGEKPLLSCELPKEGFNPESQEYTAPPEEQTGNAVYLNRSFDEENMAEFTYFNVNAKSNKITVETDKRTQNKYARLLKQSSEDAMLDANFQGARYTVLEADFSTTNADCWARPFVIKDAANSFSYLLESHQGSVVLPDGRAVCGLRKNKWYHIALAADFKKHVYDVYLDKQLLYRDVPMPNASAGYPAVWRIAVEVGAGEGDLLVDNVRAYEGKGLRDLENETVEVSQIPNYTKEEDVKEALGKAVAVSLTGGSMYAGGEKRYLENPPYVKEGRTMMPVRAVAEAFGLPVEYDPSNQTIQIGDKATLTVGEKKMLAGGVEKPLEVAPEVVDGSAFLPLRALCEEALGKTVTWYDRGVAVIDDKPFEMVSNVWDQAVKCNWEDICDYLLYLRPDKQRLLKLFESYNQNQRPRVLIDKARLEEILSDFQTDPHVKEWGSNVIRIADGNLPKELVKYEIPDGLRLLAAGREVLTRFMNWGMAYLLTGDKKYVDRTWTELENVTGWPDWNAQRHFLDPSEIGMGVSVVYDWMYDEWTGQQRETIEKALIKFQLEPARAEYYSTASGVNSWTRVLHNWNAVCNGSAAATSLALMDKYPELCGEVSALAIRGMEYMLRSFYPEGAWNEGPDYWCYMMQYFSSFGATIQNGYGTDFNLLKAPGLEKTAWYVFAINGPAGVYNFHDMAPSSSQVKVPYLFWLANTFQDSGAAGAFLGQLDRSGWSAGSAYNSYAVLFYNPRTLTGGGRSLEPDYAARGTELISMRSSYTDPEAVYVAGHAGEANGSHAHIDGGTFVVDMAGQRWADNLGSDDYNLPDYFNRAENGGRWLLYRLRAEGHNTLVIDPDTRPGQILTSFTTVERSESGPRGAISVLDLTEAYKDKASSVKRGFMLTDERRTVTIRDELDLKAESEVYWFMHSLADIKVLDNHTVLLEKNGRKVKLQIDCDAPSAEVSVMDAKPLPTSPAVAGQNGNAGYHKLAVHFKAKGKVNIQVKFVPADDPAAEREMEQIPIGEWSIPDGQLRPLPAAQEITSDGKPVNGFDPLVTDYTVKVPAGQSLPELKVQTARGVVSELKAASGIGDTAEIKVYRELEPEEYRKYRLRYQVIPGLGAIEGKNRLAVADITASAIPEPENQDYNVYDGDFNTRWSAEGDGQWIMLELEQAREIGEIAVAVMNGTTRTTTFELMVSEDKVNWTTVREKGETSGTTDGFEFYGAGGVRGKYIKLVGYGNSTNGWTSITELAALAAD